MEEYEEYLQIKREYNAGGQVRETIIRVGGSSSLSVSLTNPYPQNVGSYIQAVHSLSSFFLFFSSFFLLSFFSILFLFIFFLSLSFSFIVCLSLLFVSFVNVINVDMDRASIAKCIHIPCQHYIIMPSRENLSHY